MTYLQLESVSGATVIRLDQQETTGKGWQATKVTGLGMGPVALTATPSSVGSDVRFVRKLERNIDIKLSLKADSLTDRETQEAALYALLAGELKLRRVKGTGTGKYLKVYFAGGGTYAEGEGDTSDTELELVITLRAHKPDWV